jgi:hypothetical protein
MLWLRKMSESSDPASETRRTTWTYQRRRSGFAVAFGWAGSVLIAQPFDSEVLADGIHEPGRESLLLLGVNPETLFEK